jgi:hypothetical protein
MMLEMIKELFGVAHIRDDEDEVPNAKRMRNVEEEVSLSQPVSAAVPLGLHQFLLEEEFPAAPPVVVLTEEEGLPVPQGTFVAVPSEEDVPPEEEEFQAPAVTMSLTSQTLIPCIFSSQLFIAMLMGQSS